MSIDKSNIVRAVDSVMEAADVIKSYDASEFDDIGELIEIAIDEVKSALKVEFRDE